MEEIGKRAAGRKAAVSLLLITVILCINFYRRILPGMILNELFLFMLLPCLVILLVFRENPLHYGLRVGRWREGLLWTAAGIVLVGIMATLAWLLPEFPDYYTGYEASRNPSGNLWEGIARSGVQLFVWEFLFRGFLLFALIDLFGPYAIWIQMVPFALAHYGKPELETYSSIIGGLLSGWIAYRVGSFYPSWLIHWALAIGIALLLAYRS